MSGLRFDSSKTSEIGWAPSWVFAMFMNRQLIHGLHTHTNVMSKNGFPFNANLTTFNSLIRPADFNTSDNPMLIINLSLSTFIANIHELYRKRAEMEAQNTLTFQ